MDLNFNLVDTPESVADFADWLSQGGDPLSIDTETTGLEWWTPGFLRLVQFGRADGTGWAIPFGWHPRVVAWAMGMVRSSGVPVIFHNAKFDMHALESAGLPLPHWSQVHDTKILHHLDDPLSSHALKSISMERFGAWAGDGEALLKQLMQKRGYTWATVPVDEPLYWGYGVIDTILTAKLFEELQRNGRFFEAYDREMSYQRIMYGAEKRGLMIDVPYAEGLRQTWRQEVERLKASLAELGIANPNSNRQVEHALRDVGWEPDQFTETGQALLDKTVLNTLKRFPHAEMLMEYKQKVKWISTYLDPFVASGGRVHASINTMQAKTGRSSITGPPLQTLPHTHHIRNAVLPEEGHRLFAIDYSGQEYRILAALSKDPAWLEEFNTGAGDPHTLVAEAIGVDRSVAKTFNFAMVYGAGKEKLALTTGLSVNQVTKFLDIYNNRFPGIDRFKSNLETEAYHNDCKATTGGGRTVQCYPDQLYAITNYVIQGSGADVLKEAACQLDAAGLANHIMVPVHDELVFSLPEGVSSQEIADVMTNDSWYDVPLVAEAEGPFATWGEKYMV